jgi:hypothetical protein
MMRVRETLQSGAPSSGPSQSSDASIAHVRSALAVQAMLELLSDELSDSQRGLLDGFQASLRLNPPDPSMNPVVLLHAVRKLALSDEPATSIKTLRKNVLDDLVDGNTSGPPASALREKIAAALTPEQNAELKQALEPPVRKPGSVKRIQPGERKPGTRPASEPTSKSSAP